METFQNWMEQHFVPIAAKIGSEKHLVAIRDSFIAMMPITMAGSFAVLFNVLFRDIWAENLINQPQIPQLFSWLIMINGNVWWGTIAIFALIFAISFGYHLSKAYQVNALVGAFVSAASFIVVTPQGIPDTWGNIPYDYLSAKGLFTALIIGGLATAIYIFLTKKNIVIKMPESVPPAVANAFAGIIPVTVAIYVCSILAYLVSANASLLGASAIGDLITRYIQTPFLGLAEGLPLVLLTTIFVSLFWFFGLHGPNVLGPVIDGMYGTMLVENQTAYAAGQVLPYLWTKASFDSFVWIGGSGGTLALIIAILVLSKKRDEKQIAQLSLPMGIFNINEPIIFGIPIVLNPIYFIPFLIISPILAIIAYSATVLNIIPPTFIQIPWVTPPVIGAFLATGGNLMAALVALINLIIAIMIWAIFVKIANRKA